MRFLRSQLRLCYVADRSALQSGDFTGRCEQFVESGLSSLFLKLGNETLSPALWGELDRLVSLCRKRNVYCIIEDDALLAMRLGAHGVYVTNSHIDVSRLREVLGLNRFLGLNVTDVAEAQALSRSELHHQIDFVGVGPVLQMTDKKSKPIGVEKARKITESLAGKPSLWSGEIRPENVPDFGTSFADGICIGRPLDDGDLCEEMKRCHKVLAGTLGPSVWSVGHPPEDVTFRFSKLSAGEIQSKSIPYWPSVT